MEVINNNIYDYSKYLCNKESDNNILAIFAGNNYNGVEKESVEDLINHIGETNNIYKVKMNHGRNILTIDENNISHIENSIASDYYDGIITNLKNIKLQVNVADCMAVYMYDNKKEIVGLIHSGWRGTEQNIISNAVDKFKELGSNVKDINFVVSPSISQDNFEVRKDVELLFKKVSSKIDLEENKIFKYINIEELDKDNKIYINLNNIIEKQLLNLEIPKENITIIKECTYENEDRYHSYRRDKELSGRNIAIIEMK